MPDPTGEPTAYETASMRIVEQLGTRREQLGIGLNELARRTGVSAPDQYESGVIASPGLPKVLALANALDCDLVLIPRQSGADELQRAHAEIADLRQRLTAAKSTRPWPVTQQMPLAVAGARVQPWHVQALMAYDAAHDNPTPGTPPYDYTARQINTAVTWWNQRAHTGGDDA